MIKQLCIASLVLFISCRQTNNNSNKGELINEDTSSKTNETAINKTIALRNKTVKFLWRKMAYDETLKDTLNSIFVNEDYCKTITDPERAALAFVATFIGSECSWDGEAQNDRNNLKCIVLTALNLGYQCSNKHLGFLRHWFRGDKKALTELENCPTIPSTATIQNTFDEMKLTIKGNIISVWFRANGVNIREGDSWNWTETNHFQFTNGCLQLIKVDKSKVKHKRFE